MRVVVIMIMLMVVVIRRSGGNLVLFLVLAEDCPVRITEMTHGNTLPRGRISIASTSMHRHRRWY